MKTKLVPASLIIAACLFASFTNCSGKKPELVQQGTAENEGADETAIADDQAKTDPAFQKQLAGVFAAYVKLKDAFVSSNATKVKEEAKTTQAALKNVDMMLLKGAAHHDWMTYLAGLQSSLKEIQGSGDIEIQRKSFSVVSDNLYKSIKAFGLGGTEAYYEYCPMAFNNEGGYWISDQKQIRNPYFGDMMLTCGSVKETLK